MSTCLSLVHRSSLRLPHSGVDDADCLRGMCRMVIRPSQIQLGRAQAWCERHGPPALDHWGAKKEAGQRKTHHDDDDYYYYHYYYDDDDDDDGYLRDVMLDNTHDTLLFIIQPSDQTWHGVSEVIFSICLSG